MRPLTKTILGGGVAAAALFLGFQFAEMPTVAADHLDPPQRTDPSEDATPDRAADIADLYTFYGDGTVKMILTFAGPAATDQPATYDPDWMAEILGQISVKIRACHLVFGAFPE